MQIDGARVLITGGSRGIGRALAEGLLDAGAAVVVSGRTAESLQAAVGDLRGHGTIHGVCGDVAQDADAAAMVGACVEQLGGLDLLVNNAAILTQPSPIATIPAETWRAVLEVNVVGTANMIRHALPVLEAGGGGVIVNLSSGWGRHASARVAPYCASKFAVEALTQSLAEELPPAITTIALNPGIIATEMLAEAFQGDVSMYASPESLVPRWLALFARLDRSVNGASLDL